MDIIATPFLWALKGLNEIFGNYALTILIFTLLVNLLLSPLTVKRQKSAQNLMLLKKSTAMIK